jgi:hypothetical protein
MVLKRMVCLFAFWILIFSGGCLSAQQVSNDFEPVEISKPGVTVLPLPLERGGPARVILSGLEPEVTASGMFDGRKIFFFPVKQGLMGLFGADIMLSPGTYPLTINYGLGSLSESLVQEVVVRDKSYGVRDIKVPPSQVDLSPEDLKRTEEERKQTTKALATQSLVKYWKGEFLEPVSGQVNSSFGRQTRLNGVMNPRPHAGADFLVPEGTVVKAVADGQVVLTGHHFFSGSAVYIDHGLGLISMYFHLSKIDVQDGDMVKKGQRIALSGKTGRVTGAHLHYGVYLNGARLDPVSFRQMTMNIED